MSKTLAIKDPSEVKGYTLDFTPWLDDLGVTISSIDSVTGTNLTVDTYAATTKAVTVVVSGGTAGTTGKIAVSIVTSNGYTLVGTAEIPVQTK